jgi:Xaa-Pro aminopeptidase
MDDITKRDPVQVRAEDINPRYNWGRALPALGIMAVDFEERVDYRRLHRYRIGRARQALEASELGALLVFDVNNIRYLTSTKIGEWERDKLSRWAILPRGGEPILWDFGSAAVHHKLYSPWLKPENCKAGLVGLRGTVAPQFGLMKRHAEEIAAILRELGVGNMPLGVDIIEPPMMFELEKAGLKVKDGQQVMLEAREIKSADEIALLNRAAAMVDGAYQLIDEELKPGVRENDIVAKVNEFLYRHGSDDVEAINAISGERCNPHPHNFTDRMIRPGDQAFFDILQAFMGYRTCYYRTFNVGRATPAQRDAYKLCREWLDKAIELIHRQGVQRMAESAGVRLSRRDVSLRPAVRPRARLGAARTADHQPRRVARSSDRDQGRHGVCARDLLPGQGRLFSGAHRGGGGGHRQGPSHYLAVPGRRAADLPSLLKMLPSAGNAHEAALRPQIRLAQTGGGGSRAAAGAAVLDRRRGAGDLCSAGFRLQRSGAGCTAQRGHRAGSVARLSVRGAAQLDCRISAAHWYLSATRRKPFAVFCHNGPRCGA